MLNDLLMARSGPGGENRSLFMTTAVVLTALAAITLLSRSLVIPLHEDIVYITVAARNLLYDGNLRNSGLCFSFQVLRPEFHSTNPFFAHYLVAVFYFWPFFKLLGATDFAFYMGQAVLLVLLGTFMAKSGMGWRWSLLTISVSVVTGTTVESICLSPSQLIAICLMAYFWLRMEKPGKPHPMFDGLLIGISSATRPEAVVMGVLSIIGQAFELPGSKKRARFIGLTAASAVAIILVLAQCRKALGAASGYDNRLLLLTADVLAPGFQVLSLSHFPPLSALFHDPVLFSGFCHKVIHNLATGFGPSSVIGQRPDRVLLILPFLFIAGKIASFRNYAPAFILLIFQIVLNAALLPMPRHCDAVLFFFLWALARDLKRWSELRAAKSRLLFQTAALVASAVVLAVPLRTLARVFRGSLQARTMLLVSSKEAHRRVPQDAFVITDQPELWLWYGQGKMSCFVPFNNPETMRLVLQKFPRAYMVMFYGDKRASYPLAQFHRPLLSSAHHVMIYGPAAE